MQVSGTLRDRAPQQTLVVESVPKIDLSKRQKEPLSARADC